MTDRELLELAAKAAGIVAHHWTDAGAPALNDGINEDIRVWNPLRDPGDALRLAVALGRDLTLRRGVFRNRPFVQVEIPPVYRPSGENWFEEEAREEQGVDILAATMRAIVRAAAEIGREMK